MHVSMNERGREMEQIKKLWKRWKQIFLYLFFGGVTTVVNIIAFFISYEVLGINSIISTVLAWIAAVAVAYITNKIFVFESITATLRELIREITAFLSCRLVSLGADVFIMWLFNEILGYNAVLVKILANFIVVVMNYIFSKLFIFKGEK